MLMTLSDAAKAIESGKWLHIAGSADLLGKLPKGNWIGGSTEYFMDSTGGKVANDILFVSEIPYPVCKIAEYDEKDIHRITKDAYENGFSLIILPFDSEVHKTYAKNAAGFTDMFLKNIIGWVSGVNLSVPGQVPVTVNGKTGKASSAKAMVMHVELPQDKIASVGIVNIFEPDSKSPVIEFPEDSFSATQCFVNRKEVSLAAYIAENGVDTKLPLIGEYGGVGVNVSFKQMEGDVVHFYAPVFKGIKYRLAAPMKDYAKEFKRRLKELDGDGSVFSCNCILNFLYGELEGKKIQSFFGPITFGEIAYQLVNQTLVYLVIQ